LLGEAGERSKIKSMRQRVVFPGGGFPIYYAPYSRTRRERTPLAEFVPGASRGVLFIRDN